MWLVKLVIFDKWNMICEYIVLCELWNINVYELNVIYLCFVKLCIKFGIFHIANYGPARRTIGPRAFRPGPAQKSANGPCRAGPLIVFNIKFIIEYILQYINFMSKILMLFSKVGQT